MGKKASFMYLYQKFPDLFEVKLKGILKGPDIRNHISNGKFDVVINRLE